MKNESKTNPCYQNSWTNTSRLIKSTFPKFENDDIEALDGDLNLLPQEIKNVYGYDDALANREFIEFKRILKSVKETGEQHVLE